jgi:hypothetical protein
MAKVNEVFGDLMVPLSRHHFAPVRPPQYFYFIKFIKFLNIKIYFYCFFGGGVEQVCALVNSLKYCEAVLKDWGEQLFFLQLRQGELAIGESDDYSLADARQESDDTHGAVFDGTYFF